MSTLKFSKVNALPVTLVPNTLYIVKDTLVEHAELYVSDSSGTGVRRLPTIQDVVDHILSLDTINHPVITLNGRTDLLTSTDAILNLTATATTTLNCALASIFRVAHNVNITTLAFSNVPPSGKQFTITLFLKQDGTGGRTITWPASVRWPGGVTPPLSGIANRTDVFTLSTVDGGVTWFGFVSGLNYNI